MSKDPENVALVAQLRDVIIDQVTAKFSFTRQEMLDGKYNDIAIPLAQELHDDVQYFPELFKNKELLDKVIAPRIGDILVEVLAKDKNPGSDGKWELDDVKAQELWDDQRPESNRFRTSCINDLNYVDDVYQRFSDIDKIDNRANYEKSISATKDFLTHARQMPIIVDVIDSTAPRAIDDQIYSYVANSITQNVFTRLGDKKIKFEADAAPKMTKRLELMLKQREVSFKDLMQHKNELATPITNELQNELTKQKPNVLRAAFPWDAKITDEVLYNLSSLILRNVKQKIDQSFADKSKAQLGELHLIKDQKIIEVQSNKNKKKTQEPIPGPNTSTFRPQQTTDNPQEVQPSTASELGFDGKVQNNIDNTKYKLGKKVAGPVITAPNTLKATDNINQKSESDLQELEHKEIAAKNLAQLKSTNAVIDGIFENLEAKGFKLTDDSRSKIKNATSDLQSIPHEYSTYYKDELVSNLADEMTNKRSFMSKFTSLFTHKFDISSDKLGQIANKAKQDANELIESGLVPKIAMPAGRSSLPAVETVKFSPNELDQKRTAAYKEILDAQQPPIAKSLSRMNSSDSGYTSDASASSSKSQSKNNATKQHSL
jgi:hypothetical protein